MRLLCPVDGRPVPMIQWYRADTGQVTDWEWEPRYRTNKRSLKIKEVDRTDAGIFICKAVNGFGKEEIEINLIVIDPKDFPGLPPGELPDVSPPRLSLETETAARRYERRPGEDLRIVCSASGRPEPELVWHKNGHELLENTRDRSGKSVLVLNSLMARDEATYTCVARNLVGETRRDFVLSMEKAERTDLSGPANKTVREGDSATFDCEVTSTEKPHIKWLKKLEAGDYGYNNDEELISVDEDKYRLIHSSREIRQQRPDTYLSQLELAAVTGHMSGLYICFVTNSRGTFTHKGAFLTVIPSELICRVQTYLKYVCFRFSITDRRLSLNPDSSHQPHCHGCHHPPGHYWLCGQEETQGHQWAPRDRRGVSQPDAGAGPVPGRV